MTAIQQPLVFRLPGDIALEGDLFVPIRPIGLVIFAHGSGSSRFSPRNRFVAGVLNDAGFATLLTDLLTEEEDADYETRFDIPLLTDRLVEVTRAVTVRPDAGSLPVGFFGASTGAAAALRAAARMGRQVRAVVSRGGRADLAGDALVAVTAPTLLIVGSLDTAVLRMNRDALSQLQCPGLLEIVEGASHLFEEPGKLAAVAALARRWFSQHLTTAKQPVP